MVTATGYYLRGIISHHRRKLRSQIQASETEDVTAGQERNSALPELWYARAVTYEVNCVEKTVLTSLPADRYKAKEVAELYYSRWEIEVGSRNLKSSQLNNALVLRSRKVELLEQEVWGMLLAYKLIRREATKAASEISFKFAFQFIATEMIVLGNTASPGTIPKRLVHLRVLWKQCS